MTPNLIAGAIAVAATASLFGALEWKAGTTPTKAGFWYEEHTFALPDDVAARLGGPLVAAEIFFASEAGSRDYSIRSFRLQAEDPAGCPGRPEGRPLRTSG